VLELEGLGDIVTPMVGNCSLEWDKARLNMTLPPRNDRTEPPRLKSTPVERKECVSPKKLCVLLCAGGVWFDILHCLTNRRNVGLCVELP